MIGFSVNGKRVDLEVILHSAVVGDSRTARAHRNKIWVRHGAVRRVYGAYQWRSGTLVCCGSVAGGWEIRDDDRRAVAGPE